jgi:O-antigen ligase
MTGRLSTPRWYLATYVVVLGLLVSFSRGGIGAFVAGLVVLIVARRWRAVLRVWPPLVGAVVAVAFLVPSVPADTAPRVGLAVGGLVLGAGASCLSALRPALRWSLLAAGLVVLVVAVLSAHPGHAWSEISDTRLSAQSADRTHERQATWQLVEQQPWTGTGPGHFRIFWTQDGHMVSARFTHNEYLQLWAEDGIVALAIVVAGVAALVTRLFRSRGTPVPWSRAAALAALVALGLQSGLDFLWHVPAVPLVTAVAVAVATMAPTVEDSEGAALTS